MTTEPTPRTLRHYLTLWSGQAVSLLGSQIVQFALIWWLTRETGSATILATASLVGLLPQVVLGPFVGVLVDRWSRRRTMFAADSVVALATAVLALLFWTGVAQLWHVFAILFVRSLGGAFHWPAMNASAALMVPPARLTRIQGLNQMLNGGLSIAAAPLGALLVETIPLQAILAIDVGTALLAIGPLLFIHIPRPARTVAADGSMITDFWGEMRAGLRYVADWPALMGVLMLALVLNFILTPAFSLLPLLVTDHFAGGAFHLGWLNAATGTGIILGGLLLGMWGGFENKMHTSLIGVVGIGAGTLSLGVVSADAFWFAVAGIFVAGFMQALANGPLLAVMQAVVAPEMQGRVFNLLGSGSAAMAPLGLLLAGPIADWLGVRSWFIAGGIIPLLVGLYALTRSDLLNLEATAAAGPSAEAAPRAVVEEAPPALP